MRWVKRKSGFALRSQEGLWCSRQPLHLSFSFFLRGTGQIDVVVVVAVVVVVVVIVAGCWLLAVLLVVAGVLAGRRTVSPFGEG